MTSPCAAKGGDPAPFLSEMSELMGLPADSGDALKDPNTFWGPGGLMCRLKANGDEVTAVQPQVMLPMPADELQGHEVDRLLAIQAAMVSETGWCLGVSREGMMQVSLMKWIDVPGEAVEALDLGNAVALQTLHLLLDGDENAEDFGDELSAPTPHCRPDICH